MEQSGSSELSEEYKRLFALNNSLSDRLDDYEKIIRDRDREIAMLQAMMSESNAYRSNLDTDMAQLQTIQQTIAHLQQQAAGTSFIGSSRITPTQTSGEIERQLEDLQLQYTYLQTQLSDLQKQVLELNNRNLLLQQHSSRIAELESLLEIAEQEIADFRESK